MTTVAKLGLVGVALGDACICEAHSVLFPGRRNVGPFAITDDRFLPIVQEVYVAGAHILSRLHALFLTRRQLQLWRALRTSVEPTIPDRHGSDSEKDYYDCRYKTLVIQHSLRETGQSRAASGSG